MSIDKKFLMDKLWEASSRITTIVDAIPAEHDILCKHLAKAMKCFAHFAFDLSNLDDIEKEQGSPDL